jgi:hypothetical protein
MTATKPYVLVLHRPSGRGFTMTRNYNIIQSLIENVAVEDRVVDTWDSWMPSFQRPDWTKDLPDEEFLAVWYDHHG